MISELSSQLLDILDKRSTFDSDVLASELGVDHQKLIGAIKSLQTIEGLIEVENITQKFITLNDEGKGIVKNGSYEFNVYQKIGDKGATVSELEKIHKRDVGISKAIQNNWICPEKGTGGKKAIVRYVRKEKDVSDLTREFLVRLQLNDETVPASTITELKKRKLITENQLKLLRLKKGRNFTTTPEKLEVDVTSEMVSTGSWQNKTFKALNVKAIPIAPSSGHLHPLLKMRAEFRDIFFQMGFTEMPTNRYVESSFWNFDALFQPQQHPARDSHDTFFVSDPAESVQFPQDYLAMVKATHENGGNCNSIGYGCEWDLAEAQKNVLRTHTTAISARELYKYAKEKKCYQPTKMFSIDRVYRNETLDATHLAEFHQVEGVIVEKNLSLSHVIGLFTEFFKKCGITSLRFKPTYNPYTEPSMEIFSFHEGLQKWVEIGNSGMFRPEMLLPMGFPADVNVAGFGLSLERPTMIRFGIKNIREMFGHKTDLTMIQTNPILRLT